VARRGEREIHTAFGGENGKRRLRRPALDAIIILKRILKKLKARAWTGFIWLRMETFCGLL